MGKWVMTYYTFQDNTPCNTMSTSSERPLIPFVSVAVPFRFMKEKDAKKGIWKYGDQIYVRFLDGRTMPDGKKHTGWVQIDDYCGDHGDDDYCYQKMKGEKYPNVDLYIGDYTQSKMGCGGSGPAGSGQEITEVISGPAPAGKFVKSYGGAATGKGKKCDCKAAQSEVEKVCKSAWAYTPTYEKWWDDVCK